MEPRKVILSAYKIKQPIGVFFVAVVSSSELVGISYADIRRMEKEQGEVREIEKYLGIQRPLRKDRVKEIEKYVTNIDATFPTAIIVAVDSKCAEWDEDRQVLTLSEYFAKDKTEKDIPFDRLAQILDGQHRVKGLENYKGEEFELPVCIFVGPDISTQATIFATVNLAQTKVNKSLVYDLFELANTRSPQQTAHNIAVVLDREADSPFYKRIKRLGSATDGRTGETITQATFVEALMRHISADAASDRAILLRKEPLKWPTPSELNNHIFRMLFFEGNDQSIGSSVWAYFDAVKQRWPKAWNNMDRGNILNRTNGLKAFMRFINPVYHYLGKTPKETLSADEVFLLLKNVNLNDGDFNSTKFLPGTSGESELLRILNESLPKK